jgi:hypothetical protein
MTPARITMTEAARLRGINRKTAWRRYRKYATRHTDGKLRIPLERVLADKISEDPSTPLLPELLEIRELTDALALGQVRLARRIADIEKRLSRATGEASRGTCATP